MYQILIWLTVLAFVGGLLGDKEAKIICLACIGVFITGSVVAFMDFWQGYPPLDNLAPLPAYSAPLMMVAIGAGLRKICSRVFRVTPEGRARLTKA